MLVVDALAAFRLTRLVNADVVTEEPRRAFVQWAFRRAGLGELDVRSDQTVVEVLGDHDAEGGEIPKLATLITCPWCVSVYLAAGVVVARRFAPRVWAPVAELLALSAVAGLASSAVSVAEAG